MRNYIVGLFIFMIFALTVKAQSNYSNSSKIWHCEILIPDGANNNDCNGFVRFNIYNKNKLEIQISARFIENYLKTGKIINLPSNPVLPDMNLGELTPGYFAQIKSGAFYINSSSAKKLTSVGKIFRVDLDNIPTIDESTTLSSDHNYTVIPTTACQSVSEISKSVRSVQYIDGLGRPDQLIQVGSSPKGYGIVQPMSYDDFGREKKRYLPYALTNSSGGQGC